jgi:hypothetical protein
MRLDHNPSLCKRRNARQQLHLSTVAELHREILLYCPARIAGVDRNDYTLPKNRVPHLNYSRDTGAKKVVEVQGAVTRHLKSGRLEAAPILALLNWRRSRL